MAENRFTRDGGSSFPVWFSSFAFFNLSPQIAKRFVDSFGTQNSSSSSVSIMVSIVVTFIFHFTLIDLPIFK